MTSTSTSPLHALHLSLNAKMVPFAGYSMPIQYQEGIIKEHLHTREAAGLFDVSHMGRVVISGRQGTQHLESLVVADLEALAIGQQTYTLLTNEQGGVIDDLMVLKLAPEVYSLVLNASRKHVDLTHIRHHLGDSVQLTHYFDDVLVALQGPQACQVLSRLQPEVNHLFFMQGATLELLGVPCLVTRSGYTGEDGFEISIPKEHGLKLTECLLESPEVKPIGLGARDSLRLEAGLCLYGQDLLENTSPVESSLKWAVAKSRRPGGNKAGGYLGADLISEQFLTGVARQRVALEVEGRAPIRQGAVLLNADGQTIGEVTSGGFAPSLNRPIAMGYVKREYSQIGTEFVAEVRGKSRPVKVAKAPFVPNRYVRPD